MIFPHLQLYNEQKPETHHYSDTPDMSQNDVYNSYGNSEFDDNVFDVDLFYNADNIHSITIDIEKY